VTPEQFHKEWATPQLVKKSLLDFLTALQPPSILLRAKCCYPERLEKSSLSGRRFIQLENSRFPLPVADKGNRLFRSRASCCLLSAGSSLQCGKESKEP
jgi:hypothetical protein